MRWFTVSDINQKVSKIPFENKIHISFRNIIHKHTNTRGNTEIINTIVVEWVTYPKHDRFNPHMTDGR